MAACGSVALMLTNVQKYCTSDDCATLPVQERHHQHSALHDVASCEYRELPGLHPKPPSKFLQVTRNLTASGTLMASILFSREQQFNAT